MEMKIGQILLDEQYLDYIREKLYGTDTVMVVDRVFLLNCMWRNNELMRLRKFYEKNKALADGQKIKEEMGLC